MRFWSLSLVAILLLTVASPSAVLAEEECAPSECPQGSKKGQAPPADSESESSESNDTGNATPSEKTNKTAREPPGRASAEERRSAREAALEERKAQRETAWEEVLNSRLARVEDDRRAELMERLPLHLRDHVGLLVKEGQHYDGTFVSFAPDPQTGVLQDVAARDQILFEEIYAPLAPGSEAAVDAHGKTFHVSGAAWDFRLTDHPTMPIKFRTDPAEPFLLTLPAGANVTQTTYGLQLIYNTSERAGLQGRLVGAAVLDPADPATIIVDGDATFHLSAERVLLSQVANQVRPELEAALAQRNLGAEVTLVRTEDTELFDDTVLYEDLELEIEPGTVSGTRTTGGAYTLTVDSASHTGKTVVVNFESGLIDTSDLAFRYYNVDPDRTVEAPIMKASSLADVLDPLDDGAVAEYWVVEDEDGTQVLVSFPHFSTHKVELLSMVDVVVERPSLVLGTVGAALIVSMAAVGLFRRPDDDQ